MDIRTADADIGHEAKIGRISDEAVFYLMSRGLSEEDARAMIVSGFADNVSKELPLEYAVEKTVDGDRCDDRKCDHGRYHDDKLCLMKRGTKWNRK